MINGCKEEVGVINISNIHVYINSKKLEIQSVYLGKNYV